MSYVVLFVGIGFLILILVLGIVCFLLFYDTEKKVVPPEVDINFVPQSGTVPLDTKIYIRHSLYDVSKMSYYSAVECQSQNIVRVNDRILTTGTNENAQWIIREKEFLDVPGTGQTAKGYLIESVKLPGYFLSLGRDSSGNTVTVLNQEILSGNYYDVNSSIIMYISEMPGKGFIVQTYYGDFVLSDDYITSVFCATQYRVGLFAIRRAYQNKDFQQFMIVPTP